MTFAGLIYHHFESSLCVKIFPAGLHNQIDWTCAAVSENGFDFFSFKERQTKENFIEYRQNEDLNILPLRVKETVRYKCIVSYENKNEYSVFCGFNPHLKNESNRLLKIERDDNVSLTFQFVNYLGKTELIYDGKDGEHHLPFEVVPDKINYEEDYVKLTEAIAEECSALLFDYTSPTSLVFQQDSARNANIIEQFIFIRQFCFSDNLENLFASIKSNPDRILIKEESLEPFGHGIPSQKFFSNPFSHSRGWTKTGGGFYVPGEISVVHKYDSYDTVANRFVKFALLTFREVSSKVLEKVSVDKNGKEYFSEAKKILFQIDIILNDSFFDDINELEMMPVNNQVLEKREGYSQIFNAFSMLDLALQLDWKGKDDVYTGEAKNTALLYEYWLFFELRKIIYELSGKDSASKAEPYTKFIDDDNGLTVSLRQGNPSVQTFCFEKEQLTVNLYYNRTFSPAQFSSTIYWGSYSRPFRPDYTLAIFSSRYKRELEAIKAGDVSYIHFDAKYRIQDLTQFINSEKKNVSEDFFEKQDEQVSEKENEEISMEKMDENINTYRRGDLLKMHTYNDAIRRTVGSYVLYPGNENYDRRNELSSVYDEILPGVGAFAIRPGNENEGHKAIKEFIEKIIEFKANEASRNSRTTYFENMILQTPSIDSEQKASDSNPDLTMIGYVKEDYYSYLKQKGFLPKDKNDILQRGKKFYFYFRAIKNGKVYTLHKETSKAKYLRFTLKKLVEVKIKPGQSFEELEPWNAEIISTRLVSKEQLELILEDYVKMMNHTFSAEYYYLVEAEFLHFYQGGIVAVCTEENDIISPYSPKIVQLSEGNEE